MLEAVHIPLSTQPVMPWANGGGTTRQIAIDPPTGSLATGFRWRVSTAQVARDGPFSRLPGVNRSMWLLRGAGMRLDVGGREVRLDRPLQRFDFAGEVHVVAHLIDGPVADLNVMVARDQVRADAALRAFAQGAAIDVQAGAPALLWLLDGRLATPGGAVASGGDAFRLDGSEPLVLRAEAAGRLLVVRFSGIGARP